VNNRRTGATTIVPGSHKKVAEIDGRRRGKGPNRGLPDTMTEQEKMDYVGHFTDEGLQPGILNVTAGDLVFFNTALFHGTCMAEDQVRVLCVGPTPIIDLIGIEAAKKSVPRVTPGFETSIENELTALKRLGLGCKRSQ